MNSAVFSCCVVVRWPGERERLFLWWKSRGAELEGWFHVRGTVSWNPDRLSCSIAFSFYQLRFAAEIKYLNFSTEALLEKQFIKSYFRTFFILC